MQSDDEELEESSQNTEEDLMEAMVPFEYSQLVQDLTAILDRDGPSAFDDVVFPFNHASLSESEAHEGSSQHLQLAQGPLLPSDSQHHITLAFSMGRGAAAQAEVERQQASSSASSRRAHPYRSVPSQDVRKPRGRPRKFPRPETTSSSADSMSIPDASSTTPPQQDGSPHASAAAAAVAASTKPARKRRPSSTASSHQESLNSPRSSFASADPDSTGEDLVTSSDMYTSARPFKCTWKLCTKAFESNSKLNRHMVTHTGARDVACEHCLRPFSQRSSMLAHVRNTHPELFENTPRRTRRPNLRRQSVDAESHVAADNVVAEPDAQLDAPSLGLLGNVTQDELEEALSSLGSPDGDDSPIAALMVPEPVAAPLIPQYTSANLLMAATLLTFFAAVQSQSANLPASVLPAPVVPNDSGAEASEQESAENRAP